MLQAKVNWAGTLVVLTSCGGGAQQTQTRDDGDVHFVVMNNGKPAWPPVGSGCDAFVLSCKDASPDRPEVALVCQLGVGNCASGRRSVVELLEHDEVAVPASCR